ncbi:agmatinase [Colwellia hornerae]|uniref:Agmatinase n=2 Tax=Colwellia hornerae TaxID=89402 RepID=A0A5C6QJC5_9GAMM|nr:agmatinase [Colwellia hornerae]TWX60261.1 agmatinase [Colwellia hornerae]TWX69054.1 agmatinase [Colwellia hornerae]
MVKEINVALISTPTPFEGAQNKWGIFQDTSHIIGFEFDGTACFRKGTKAGPNALRDVSDGIESYSPYLDADLEDISFVDLGNLPFDLSIDEESSQTDIENAYHNANSDFNTLFENVALKDNNVRIVSLGGEHSISYAPIKKYLSEFPDLVILHLDAHADLRDGYLGYHYSHAAIIRRITDHFGKDHQLIQYGIRSGTREEYQWMKAHQTLKKSRAEFLASVDAIAKDIPIYLTLDLDYFDPSFFPGTGTPEPGGEDFHSLISLCKILRSKYFVGCDVVELSPKIDSTGNSDVFAAKVVRELLLCLAGPSPAL